MRETMRTRKNETGSGRLRQRMRVRERMPAIKQFLLHFDLITFVNSFCLSQSHVQYLTLFSGNFTNNDKRST